MTDADKIAEFLASRGATRVADGVAYGVDREADRLKRIAERERASVLQAENRAERAAELFAAGDREAGFAVWTGYERTGPGRYRRVRMDRY